MQAQFSTTTPTRTTISLRLSKWHTPQTCTCCGETIPAGTASRHYFEGDQMMIVCTTCAKGPAFAAGPSLWANDACPVCGSRMEGYNCYNLCCPVGFANIQREVGAGSEPDPAYEPEDLPEVVAA